MSKRSKILKGWGGSLAVLASVLPAILLILVAGPAYTIESGNYEAEHMQFPSDKGKIFDDNTASADKGLEITRNGVASQSVTMPSTGRILVRARGDQCNGAPLMVVKVHDKQVMSKPVTSQRSWSRYESAQVPKGTHRVTVAFTNDYRNSSCDRDLRLDKVKPMLAESSEKQLALGVWNPYVPWDMTNLDKYVDQVNREPGIVLMFQSWGPRNEAGFCAECADRVLARGSSLVLTWVGQDYTRSSMSDQPDYSLKTVIRGDHDDYIRTYARDIAQWGKPIKVRLNHEMNGDWNAYGARVNGNEPGEFVAAWKHIHNIFEQERATNVEWVWSPSATGKAVWPDDMPLSRYYPGDAYVDWVALDGYNWGSYQNRGWYSLAEIFGPSYKEITALTDKPLMIAETASCEGGGDKAAWIRQGFLRDIPTKFPKVRAVIWYNHNERCAQRMDSSRETLDAWREVVASPMYQGKLP